MAHKARVLSGNVTLIGAPSDKQRKFFETTAKFVAYGGSRGGGKSWALRRKLILMCLRYPKFRALVIRRTYGELSENHITPLRSELGKIASYSGTYKLFTFPNGSSIKMGYCDSEGDVLQYQGQEYDCIAIDEATQLTEFQFSIFKACLRGANAYPKRIYLTCNPGGVGHSWVKRLFIDREYKRGEDAADYAFIQASVFDNTALVSKNPEYVSQLESLPDDLREAWLYGKWDTFSGQYFPEFDWDVHTIPPRPPKQGSRIVCAMDYGLDMFACLFVAVEPDGTSYVFREIHRSELIVSEAAYALKQAVLSFPAGVGEPCEYIAPSDLWSRQKDTGKTIAGLFADNGIYLSKLVSGRVEGWLALKELMKPRDREDGARCADLQISRECGNIARNLPLLMHDPLRVDDTSTKPHEITHAPDALRYYAVSRQSAPRPSKRKTTAGLYRVGRK